MIPPSNTQMPAANEIEQVVLAALGGVIDPEIRQPITDLGMVETISASASGRVKAVIRLTIVGCPAADRIKKDVATAIEKVVGAGNAEVALTVMTPEQRAGLIEKLRGGRQRTNQFGPGSLTRVIAITSGKGGVGKSTLTVNLAVALAARGLKVGIIDADIHGFSVPKLLGMHAGEIYQPTRVGDMIMPPIAHDVKAISIGMFLQAGKPLTSGQQAVAWRGPMLHRTLNQFLTDTYFGDLDMLLLDLPPGTGDIAISFGQLLPNAEVVVVTTPQAAAVEVAERSGLVARKSGQRIVGVIENMAGFQTPDGTVVDLFGAGGGMELADRLSENTKVPLIASVPLSIALRESGDNGDPLVLSYPSDPAAAAIRRAAVALAQLPRGLAHRHLGVTQTK